MHKGFIKLAAIFGALSVALGAFGAHGLQKVLTDEKAIQTYRTGVQYQMYHSLALLAIAILYHHFPATLLKKAGTCFIIGIILFSGSLYAITLFKVNASTVPPFIGPVTPLGGLFFIAGWLLLFLAILKKKD